MNTKQLLTKLMMVWALGAVVLFASCDDGDDDNGTECTLELDKDCYCSENPEDEACEEEEDCTFEEDAECFCENNEDDEQCCTLELNKDCFCEANPSDEACISGLGTIIDFEEGLSSFSPDFYNPSGLIEFDGDENISAKVGDHYMSLVIPASDSANRTWHDFKYWPATMDEDETNDESYMIDLTEIEDPYLNMWVNSGAADTDSLGFTVAFWGREGDADNHDYAVHPLFKATTGGEWKLYSFSILEMKAQDNWDGGEHAIDVNAKWIAIKFAFLPDYWNITGDFTCHVDDISITDGPLGQ